ncbi:NAD(P)H-dependent oxidoreductase [Trinickia sp. NRRL B-1857]|uniref:FMN-dependent NADH-azoreductase n=1 Tax=Trinickia sp. NRRL B-1857 TaxID=3162879 RepID=UPI003D2B91D7
MKLLYVKGSPRGDRSRSAQVAALFIAAYRARHPNAEIEELDLWQASLPEFDGDRAAAKMSFFGDPEMNGAQRTAWDEIARIANHFACADDFLFTVPMWNSGIPYRLKLYIDVITQPGLLFGFDPATGYNGLLKNKRATAIYTSGVYGPGVAKRFGRDFHAAYFDDWLRFIGIDDIVSVRYQPNILTADAAAGLASAQQAAKEAAER